MSVDQIKSIKTTYGADYACQISEFHGHVPGETVTMNNGERWFHAYNGSRPMRLENEEQPS